MKTANNVSNVNFMSPDADRQMEIQRRLAMSQALQGQAMEPLDVKQSVGGWAIPLHPLQGAAKLAQGYVSGMAANKAQTMAKALGEEQQQRRGADMSLLVNALRGRQASPGGLSEDASGNVTQMDPVQAMSPMQGLQQALPMIQDPQMQQFGMKAIMDHMPKKPEPFTLAPGATRYDPSGSPIVTAPKPVEPYTLGPGAMRMGPNNQVVAQAPFKPEPDQGNWSDPFEMNGAMVQKNSKTGEIRTAVSRPPVTNVQTSVNAPPPSKVFENENKLRDDYTTATKPFVGIRDAYNTVKAALSGPITAVSTLAGATKFMKMIDPESVVRESELQMALKASGMLDRFMNLHNVVLKGQVLTPTQAKEIQNIAETLYSAAEQQQSVTDEYYTKLAKDYGLAPERVIRKQGAVMRGDRRSESRDNKTVVVDF